MIRVVIIFKTGKIRITNNVRLFRDFSDVLKKVPELLFENIRYTSPKHPGKELFFELNEIHPLGAIYIEKDLIENDQKAS